MSKRFLITGGAGFIGSAVVRHLIAATGYEVLVVDKLTYAGNLASLAAVTRDSRFHFIQADIGDQPKMRELFEDFMPDVVMNLAAESHVDRSIDRPDEFIQTNVVGTFGLLQCALGYWRRCTSTTAHQFRFHHISTDEVFGSLESDDVCREDSPYRPRSPYAASKAAADHLVMAWNHTYGLPTVISNCTNNYGPYHFPEKLIPLTILNGLEGRPLPIYGTGENVRDWLYVDDHARALVTIAERGRVGSSYCVAGSSERTNLAVVREVCRLLDTLAPDRTIGPREQLMTLVEDRLGHDLRYALDDSKVRRELGWRPQVGFETGLRKTVEWYLANRAWWEPIRKGVYGGERLGAAAAP